MTSARAAALVGERRRRNRFPAAVEALRAGLFDQQRLLVESPNKRKVCDSGRRSGKTHAGHVIGLDACERFPGTVVPVFERTLTCFAAETFWADLQLVDKTYGLGLDFHHTLKRATCPNGSVVQLMGADTREAADKGRGGKHPVVIIDEAGTFRDSVLRYLITDVCEPATMDLDGTIVVMGTPRPVRGGPFFQMVSGSGGWEHHHWNAVDNPTLGPIELTPDERRAWRVEWLRKLRERQGWTETTPAYMREYLGLWPAQFDDRLTTFSRERNVVLEMPGGGGWRYALAMDLGFNDPNAYIVLAARRGDPYVYVPFSYEKTGQIPSAAAAEVERLRAQYSFVRMTADTGGYGKAVVEEMRQRFGLPIHAARKRDKMVYVEFLNNEFSTGRLKIVSRGNEALIDDLLVLAKNEDGTDTAPNQRDHLFDALNYGVRDLPTWNQALGEREGPAPGSAEWYRAEEDRMEAVALRQLERHTEETDDGGWKEKFYDIGD